MRNETELKKLFPKFKKHLNKRISKQQTVRYHLNS